VTRRWRAAPTTNGSDRPIPEVRQGKLPSTKLTFRTNSEAIVGIVATLALGVPILKLFIRRGYTSGPAFLGAGIIISAALGAVFYGSHQFGEKLMDMDFHFAMIAVLISGPLAGLSFWLLYRRQ
jgi:hypothetical protein